MGFFMKAVICLLFPVLLFAQNPFPDNLLLSDGRTYPCLVTSIDDSKLEFVYLNNKSESIVLKAVDQLTIEELGIVYSASQGFTKDINQIKKFVDERMEKLADEQLVQEELAKLTAVSNSGQIDNTGNTELVEYFEYQKPFKMKKWSFGVLLIPYYSGRIYTVNYYYGQNPPEVFVNYYADNEINMQGQLSYSILSNIMVTLDIAYSSSFSELSSEYHSRNEYNSYDDGTKRTDGLYLFDFTLGLKYYFLEFFPDNVNVYALLGFGQQFASAEVNEEDLYPDPGPNPVIEDNMAEYLEGLNSPWHLDFGFGVEYLFNESISLNSNIRFIYASVSSKYDSKIIFVEETISQSTEYSNSEFTTRIGLGLNFYF